MANEILSQVYLLSEAAKEDEKAFVEIENTLNEWNEHFMEICTENGYDSQSNIHTMKVAPSVVKTELARQKEKIKCLEQSLVKTNEQADFIRTNMAKEIDRNVEVYRKNAERERKQHSQIIDNLKTRLEKETEQIKSTLSKTQQEHSVSLQLVQKKAEEAVSKSESRRQAEFCSFRAQIEDIKENLSRKHEKELQHFLKQIKSIEQREKDSLHALKTELGNRHSAEISKLKRQLAVEKSKVQVERSKQAIFDAKSNSPQKAFLLHHSTFNNCKGSPLHKHNEDNFIGRSNDPSQKVICHNSACKNLQLRLNQLETLVHQLLYKPAATHKHCSCARSDSCCNPWKWDDIKANHKFRSCTGTFTERAPRNKISSCPGVLFDIMPPNRSRGKMQ